MLSLIPQKLPLVFAPTPLHPLETLSRETGCSIWIKRDDLTGPGLFGGNKMRKLEYLLAQAKKEGATHVLTYGASQSNHAMETAAACRRFGLEPVLFLLALVAPDAQEKKGNLKLNGLLGAEVHLLKAEDFQGRTSQEALQEEANRRMAQIKAEGGHCFEIPMGGSNALGTLGYLDAYMEMKEQCRRLGIAPFDAIYASTGSGGTWAGLLAGQACLGGREEIRGVSAGLAGETYVGQVTRLANEALVLRNLKPTLKEENLLLDQDYVGEGYEIPSAASTAALQRMARREGIFLDPVYTAKAFAALLDHIEKGDIKAGSSILFWHTGGISALFAESTIVGQLD